MDQNVRNRAIFVFLAVFWATGRRLDRRVMHGALVPISGHVQETGKMRPEEALDCYCTVSVTVVVMVVLPLVPVRVTV